MKIIETDEKYLAHTYKRFPVVLKEGKGSLIRDEDGKEYIDMGSGIGVTSFGIADDTWLAAVTAQAAKLQHTSNLYYTEPCTLLAEKLCQKTGMKKVFFSNSGAEANECAIKAARKYAAEKKGAEYSTIVTLNNSFHGRTLTTLAATGQEHYHELFQPLTPGFVSADSEDIGELNNICDIYKVAAIMIECIQGEGGVNVLNPAFVSAAVKLAHERDILVITDEVQTGNGRTGKFYSYMHYNFTPDIITTAKGLGGGLPIGATLFGEKTESVFDYGDHGSTFGANPVCCAGAISILDRLDDALMEKVMEKSQFLFSEFQGTDGIESVSGIGLMIGLKTVKPAALVVQECLANGVLCLTAKDRVRLLPALTITMDELKKAAAVIKAACTD